MANNNLQLLLIFLLIWLGIQPSLSVNYNAYATNQHYRLDDDNTRNTDTTLKSNYNQENRNDARNLQDFTDYQQQLHRYYYIQPMPITPLAYQRQSQYHPSVTIQSGYQPATQLWSGPPIVVEDVVNQQPESSSSSTLSSSSPVAAIKSNQATATTVFYKQQPEIPTNRNTFLPTLNRNSNTQIPTTARQFNYNNNNHNNNIIYHRDFRPQIPVIPPDTDNVQQQHDDRMTSWYNRQQQQQYQHQLQLQMEKEYRKQQQQQQQQQQFYATNTNLRFNGMSNVLRKDTAPADYREHFRHYLENNPQRIKPIY